MRTANRLGLEMIQNAITVRRRVVIETEFGPAEFVSFSDLGDGKEHIALVYGQISGQISGQMSPDKVPLIRVHSECLTGDVFSSARCDCGEQLKEAQAKISRLGGILLYLRQEGRGIGLYNKLDAYALQDQGHDTFEANLLLGLPEDMRDYTVATKMLQALGVNAVSVLTNNPDKAAQLRSGGIEVREIVRTNVHLKNVNRGYLAAKALKGGHTIDLVKLSFKEGEAELGAVDLGGERA